MNTFGGAPSSALHERVAAALGESTEALGVIGTVPAEGVGVAPSVPTLGDRPASGHSILGLAVCEGSAVRAEAIGRCWSRGRLLAWLAEDRTGSSSVA